MRETLQREEEVQRRRREAMLQQREEEDRELQARHRARARRRAPRPNPANQHIPPLTIHGIAPFMLQTTEEEWGPNPMGQPQYFNNPDDETTQEPPGVYQV